MNYLFEKGDESGGWSVFNWKVFIVIIVLFTIALFVLWFFVFYSGDIVGESNNNNYSVGVLSGLSYARDATEGFKSRMEELGYVEGENISYDVRNIDFNISAYKEVLHNFVDNRVDLVFSYPTEASLEAKDIVASSGIPVVFAVANIEKVNLIESVKSPGNNITGVRYPGPDIALKRFEIMSRLVPEADNFLIPYQKGYPIVESQLEVLQSEAEDKDINLIKLPAQGAEDLQNSLSELDNDVDAILFLAEPLAVEPNAFSILCNFAKGRDIPAGGAYVKTEEGCRSVFGVHVDNFEAGEQAGVLADKILRGKRAGSIPVVSSESYFELDYNEAQRLNLNLSEGLTASADKIIR